MLFGGDWHALSQDYLEFVRSISSLSELDVTLLLDKVKCGGVS